MAVTHLCVVLEFLGSSVRESDSGGSVGGRNRLDLFRKWHLVWVKQFEIRRLFRCGFDTSIVGFEKKTFVFKTNEGILFINIIFEKKVNFLKECPTGSGRRCFIN